MVKPQPPTHRVYNGEFSQFKISHRSFITRHLKCYLLIKVRRYNMKKLSPSPQMNERPHCDQKRDLSEILTPASMQNSARNTWEVFVPADCLRQPDNHLKFQQYTSESYYRVSRKYFRGTACQAIRSPLSHNMCAHVVTKI